MEEEKNENSSMEPVHHYYQISELSFLYTVSSVVVLAFSHVCPDCSISLVLIGRKKRCLLVGEALLQILCYFQQKGITDILQKFTCLLLFCFLSLVGEAFSFCCSVSVYNKKIGPSKLAVFE